MALSPTLGLLALLGSWLSALGSRLFSALSSRLSALLGSQLLAPRLSAAEGLVSSRLLALLSDLSLLGCDVRLSAFGSYVLLALLSFHCPNYDTVEYAVLAMRHDMLSPNRVANCRAGAK